MLRIKHVIVNYFVSPFDTDLYFYPNLQKIISGKPVVEDVRHFLISVKDSGKKLNDLFEERITGVSNSQFFSPIIKYSL